jgi:transposase
MAKHQTRQGIPTNLSAAQFEQFVLAHLSKGGRGPAKKLEWRTIFNYILRLLYLGCQWKELPIEKDPQGRPESHYTRIYRAFRRWQADGSFNAIFEGSVLKLHQDDRLDITVIQETAGSNAASDYVISVLEELPDEKYGSPAELSKEVSNEK